jgi:hypothetical protein
VVLCVEIGGVGMKVSSTRIKFLNSFVNSFRNGRVIIIIRGGSALEILVFSLNVVVLPPSTVDINQSHRKPP